jgi:hypothetical protein
MTGWVVAVTPETELMLEPPVLLQAESTAQTSKPEINWQPTLDPIKHLPREALGAQRQAETNRFELICSRWMIACIRRSSNLSPYANNFARRLLGVLRFWLDLQGAQRCRQQRRNLERKVMLIVFFVLPKRRGVRVMSRECNILLASRRA